MRASVLKQHFAGEFEKARARGNRYVTTAYARVGRLLNTIPDKTNVTRSMVDELELTDHMKDKLKELLKLRGRPAINIRGDLEAIPGIGPKKAQELIDAGATSVAQLLRAPFKATIPEISRIYLTKRPQTIIPRNVITQIERHIANPRFDATIVGSYRRERPTSKDIDIMLIAADLDPYLEHLHSRFPDIWMYARGKDKASFVVPFDGKTYKLDVFRTPPEYKWSMLLYSTGSKEFNVRMRQRAKKMGLLLNQDGLFRGRQRLPLDSERAYFDALGMDYLSPRDRI